MAEGSDISIEIGPREYPIYPHLRSDLKGKNPLYIERWSEAVKYLNKDQPGVAVHANALNLPIKGKVAESVIIANVFGQNGIPDVYAGDSLMDKPEIDYQAITKEICRVLPVDGKVIVLETSTPPDKKELIDVFEQNGLKVDEDYDRGEIGKIFGIDTESAVIGKTLDRFSARGSYALVFKKV